MVNHFVSRVFPCPLCLGRVLPSAVNAFAGTDIVLVCRSGLEADRLRPDAGAFPTGLSKVGRSTSS